MPTRAIIRKPILDGVGDGRGLRRDLWMTSFTINKALAELESVMNLRQGRDCGSEPRESWSGRVGAQPPDDPVPGVSQCGVIP